ncbi:MAG TPA: PSD1 and planctomycete cytochrome C domain-containing protein, partial [Gemmataceae bacterium]|nr:PSD1 and planctomycete cytochrome C domain-containing protein [Gemmataceae bacterium]
MSQPPLSVRFFVLVLLAVTTQKVSSEEKTSLPATNDFFENSVRPVLSENCFRCHGPKKQENGLRLDSRAAILAGGDSGPAVAPGKPKESLILTAVRYSDDLRMPPDHKLKDKDIEALIKWVEEGALWPNYEAKSLPASVRREQKITKRDREFWSFRPIENPPLPKVKNESWPKTSIDYFVLAELEANGLQPVGAADKRTLIRRATFDLIGLPPSPAEIEAFLKDDRPGAFALVVDRLLASPHYGERWGRHWLDVARYGEDQAHTFQARKYPNGYRYRDWVASALNNDMPYDQFLMAQIAADLLDGGDRQNQLPALGFFALGPVYYGDRKKFDQLDDRIDTLTRGFLGLTVACARCHDHKFDPIPTADYYALAGIFASTEYTEAPLAPSEIVEAYQRGAKVVEDQSQKVDQFIATEAALLAVARTTEIASYMRAAWKLENRRKSNANVNVDQIASEDQLDGATLNKWVKYLKGDRPYLSRWTQLLARQDPKVDLSMNKSAVAEVGEAADAFQNYVRSVVKLRNVLKEHQTLAQANAADKEKQKSTTVLESKEVALLDEIIGAKGLLAVPANKLEDHLTSKAKDTLKSLKVELESLKQNCPPKYPSAHALKEGPNPENLKICLRGNPETLGEEVSRGFLSVLAEKPVAYSEGSGRLELARAIANKSNPLTARVMANRIWQHHFGKGLVRTPSNFGKLGERPTHPKLLDHLASRFMAEGWSLKAMHRQIMLSATYQLSSRVGASELDKDPENRLLRRMSRRRLEVEAWR